MSQFSVVLIITLLVILALSALLSNVLRYYALKQGMLDIPNERSSHITYVPRGGGFAIALPFFLCISYFQFSDIVPSNLVHVFWGAILVALIGFYDDHKDLSSSIRMLVHISAAIWTLYLLGEYPTIDIFSYQFNFGWFSGILAIVFLVWLINLYNFMDGIDGIASVETIFTATVAAVLLLESYAEISLLLSVLVAGSIGFLVWNWPPAKLFMGDVGSGFLGFVFGVFALYTSTHGIATIWFWLILLNVFIVDATVTLFYRLLTKQRWREAHCSHAYQQAARKWGSHKKVTLSVLAINVFWLLPLAVLAFYYPVLGLMFWIISSVPLVIIALKQGAGQPRSCAMVGG